MAAKTYINRRICICICVLGVHVAQRPRRRHTGIQTVPPSQRAMLPLYAAKPVLACAGCPGCGPVPCGM